MQNSGKPADSGLPYELMARDPESGDVRAVIDTPAGSRNKYKYDKACRLFRVARVLPEGMSFPHDFGSIPGTCAEDGDPLDVLVLGLAPTFPGCLVNVKLLGILGAVQVERRKRIRNDRLLAAAVTPVNTPALADIGSIDPEQLKAIRHFFESYNRAQGREFRITRTAGRRQAESALARAERRFELTHR
jgi:inorganic pyrophosphatase